MIQLFKIVNNMEEVQLINQPAFRTDSITRGNSLKYDREKCSNSKAGNIRHHFLTNRASVLWNKLDEPIVNASHPDKFKELYDKFLLDNQNN